MQSPSDADERVESLPWEHIGKPDDAGRRRLVVLAVAVFVTAVTASATRTLWPSPPLSAQSTTTVQAPPADASASPPAIPETTVVRPVTEADLRAIAPADAARAVAAHAQWFVTEWLTVDGLPSALTAAMTPDGISPAAVEGSARSFVESAIVLSVAEAGASTWEVAVLVRTLSSLGDGDYLRVPPRVFLVTVAMGDEGAFVLDLPTPGPLPVAPPPELELVEAAAPAAVIDAGVVVMRQAGLVDEASVTSARGSGLWRLSGVVRDPAGVQMEVVVWLDETGTRVPAAGAP